MTDRFEGLKKIGDQPAARFLAAGNAKLKTDLDLPARASVPEVLAALDEADAPVDMLRLLSVALPPRELVWWSCVAGRELLGPKSDELCVKAAEAWVFEPNEDNRAKARVAMENADVDDPTALCATAAFYAPGNMGPEDDMKEEPAPIGLVSSCAFGVNLKTLKLDKEPHARMQLLIDRALDIARGGNGKVKEPTKAGDAAEEKGTA